MQSRRMRISPQIRSSCLSTCDGRLSSSIGSKQVSDWISTGTHHCSLGRSRIWYY